MVGGSVYFVDPDRIKFVDGKYHVWIKGDHSRDRGERARTTMMMVSINCNASSMRMLSVTSYDSYGKVIQSQNQPDYDSGYEPITPDTMVDTLAAPLCSKNAEPEQ